MTTIVETSNPRGTRPHAEPLLPSWIHAPPRLSCPAVLRFCAELNPACQPVVVPVRPELLYGDGPYPMGRCYAGVSDYQERVGGTFQHGWMVWETEGIYLRADHHCVHWDGHQLIDVSPQGYNQIVFIATADPGISDEENLRWRGSRDGVPSRYFPLSDSALVRRILKLHQLNDDAKKFSTEWFEMLDQLTELEVQFHEWTNAKSAASRRRKALTRRSKGRK